MSNLINIINIARYHTENIDEIDIFFKEHAKTYKIVSNKQEKFVDLIIDEYFGLDSESGIMGNQLHKIIDVYSKRKQYIPFYNDIIVYDGIKWKVIQFKKDDNICAIKASSQRRMNF